MPRTTARHPALPRVGEGFLPDLDEGAPVTVLHHCSGRGAGSIRSRTERGPSVAAAVADGEATASAARLTGGVVEVIPASAP